jgi:hypothetical protein
MSDFLREIDEDLRRDRLAAFWHRFAPLLVGILVLGVIATGVWRYTEHRHIQAAQAAGASFESALALAREGKGEEAGRALATLAEGAPGGYRTLARMRAAGELAVRDPEQGLEAWRSLAREAELGPVFQDLARLRAGFILLDRAPYAEFAREIEPLAGPQGPWRHSARELLGVGAIKAGEVEAAGRWFDLILADREAPQGVRQRVGALSGLVRGGPVTVAP